ncbi:glyoxylate reductase/hydroxypyruvate reductase-like [Physella acuta]|uniref:glyoxylate reductase/hydroxypyruvate reductase-like n=1 Tax=Physella acuta TaxID=109671 RepID=UPI0027DC36D2|nr:glyoxylate reductase/hydroxypyruvate reductase-like [Physella acuta]
MTSCICMNYDYDASDKKRTRPPEAKKNFIPPAEATSRKIVFVKKVFVTTTLEEEALDMLRRNFEVVTRDPESVGELDSSIPQRLNGLAGASAILCSDTDVIDEQVIEYAGSQLEMICTMAPDTKNIDTVKCQERNIAIYHVGEYCTDSHAEFISALLLTTARRLIEGNDEVLRGDWGLWQPMHLLGTQLTGRTLGFLGIDLVGLGVAQRLRPFGIEKIIYFDKDEHPLAVNVSALKVDIEEIFAKSDFIVCTLELTPQTEGIVNAQYLGMCKPECIFINTASAALVNHDDLLQALKEEKIAGAGLDSTIPEPLPQDSELLALPNVVVTPHMSSATHRGRTRIAMRLANYMVNNLA